MDVLWGMKPVEVATIFSESMSEARRCEDPEAAYLRFRELLTGAYRSTRTTAFPRKRGLV